MKHSETFLLCVILLCVLLSSCVTYYIPLDSFKEQFSGIDSTKLIPVEIQGGVIISEKYLANPITKIKCIDKKGNPAELSNNPSIEVRFTHGEKNKRTVFFFDRVYVTDSTVSGSQSRLVPGMIKTISLSAVKKIEVQDGKKNFRYIRKR